MSNLVLVALPDIGHEVDQKLFEPDARVGGFWAGAERRSDSKCDLRALSSPANWLERIWRWAARASCTSGLRWGMGWSSSDMVEAAERHNEASDQLESVEQPFEQCAVCLLLSVLQLVNAAVDSGEHEQGNTSNWQRRWKRSTSSGIGPERLFWHQRTKAGQWDFPGRDNNEAQAAECASWLLETLGSVWRRGEWVLIRTDKSTTRVCTQCSVLWGGFAGCRGWMGRGGDGETSRDAEERSRSRKTPIVGVHR